MSAVRQIDRALKRLYNIETPLCAEKFLVNYFPIGTKKQIASKDLEGALYIQQSSVTQESEEPSVDLGIYLSERVRRELKSFPSWQSPWTLEQVKAFSVASEEISHFHYLVFNLERNRSVSEFEIELQGEIDKFLLLFFCESFSGKSGESKFEELFERLFINFRLANSLNEIQRQRYLDASIYAKMFFRKLKRNLAQKRRVSLALKQTRFFYQMDLANKMSFLHGTRD